MGAPGECGLSHNTSMTTERPQSRRPGRLVVGRTHAQGSPFSASGEIGRTSAEGAGSEPERGESQRGKGDPVAELALLPPLLVGNLVEITAGGRPAVRAEPRVHLGRELDLALVPVVDHRGERDEERGRGDGESEAGHLPHSTPPSDEAPPGRGFVAFTSRPDLR